LQQVLDNNQAVLADYSARLVAVAQDSSSAATGSDAASTSQLLILADQDGAVARQFGAPRLIPGKPKDPTSPITIYIVDSRGKIACSGPAVTDGTLYLEEWLTCTPPSDSPQP
jgi:peroxiredoxin